MNIGSIPEIHARRTPEAIAIRDGLTDRSLTWRQLELRTGSLAAGLRGVHGIGSGDAIGMLSTNSTQYFETIFAGARLGANTAGLNWRSSTGELLSWLEAIRPAILVCEGDLAEKGSELAKAFDIPLLTFGANSDRSYEDVINKGGHEPAVAYVGEYGCDHPALTINTGGTTGASKGAIHTHGSLLSIFEHQWIAESIVSTDSYQMMGQMFHIVAALAMAYLSRGCSVTHINFEPELALQTMLKYRITATTALPTMIDDLLRAQDEHGIELPFWRTMQYGGGPFTPRVVKMLLERFPCDLVQSYGCSETSGVAWLLPDDHRRAVAEGNDDLLRSAGRELGLTQVAVLDLDGNEVDKDGTTVGEIAIRSSSMFKGYTGDDSPPLRDGWLYTGDLGTWNEERYLTVAGRRKEMIISGGENIYPVNLERAIRELDGVLDAAVIGVPDERWGEAPVAFIVATNRSELNGAQVVAHVEQRLGSFQRPREVIFLDALPRSPNGKVVKRELVTWTDLPPKDAASAADMSGEERGF
jgi:acyl-CoA synthetase (AMP-forming)/AMP-acid ligase II